MAGGTLGGKADRCPSRPDAMKFADSLRPSKKAKVIHRDFSFSPHCSGSAESKAHRQSGPKAPIRGASGKRLRILQTGLRPGARAERVINLSRYAKERSTAMKWRSARRAQGRNDLVMSSSTG
jgi:hypothetical protein